MMESFDEVVNKEFLEKYSERIQEEYLPKGENGEVEFGILRVIFDMLKGWKNPNMFTYAAIHGMWNLASSWNIPGRFKGKEDEMYKECLDRDTTWEKLIDYKGVKKDELL